MSIETTTPTAERTPQAWCEDGFALRTRIVKLRWMGLDQEAERVADRLTRLGCALPARLPRRITATD